MVSGGGFDLRGRFDFDLRASTTECTDDRGVLMAETVGVGISTLMVGERICLLLSDDLACRSAFDPARRGEKLSAEIRGDDDDDCE